MIFSLEDIFLLINVDNLRVLRKNLLFCSGLPLTLT